MRTLWNIKAYEAELPPLGSSEDNLGETSSATPQTVHQSSKTELLEWAQGCSEAHWTGSSQSEPVLNQTRPLIDVLNHAGAIGTTQQGWPTYLKHKNTGLVLLNQNQSPVALTEPLRTFAGTRPNILLTHRPTRRPQRTVCLESLHLSAALFITS